jgi:mRNA-degrading endonuclease toxin of MazEF toxin-antitoxin module
LLWIKNNNGSDTKNTANWPKGDDIYLATLDPAVRHEIKKTRPALIIQNDTSNQYGAVSMVISKAPRTILACALHGIELSTTLKTGDGV